MKALAACGLGLALVFASAGTASALPASRLSDATRDLPIAASEIVARNEAARGGAAAWRRIETMAWTGHAENSNVPGRKVPFMLEQKRPGKVRFEVLEPSGTKAIRAYDGVAGWKMRAGEGGMPEITAYGRDELSFARGAQVIEGPLMDYVAKGAVLAVSGIDSVDGRRAYVVDARLPSGGLHRVWIDAESFLDLRHDREFNDASGHVAVATVRYRDYRAFEGLQLPVTIETGGGPGQPVNRLVIERVALNPPILDSAFVAPELRPARRNRIIVDTRSAAMPERAASAQRP
jgi:hypothetical protein